MTAGEYAAGVVNRKKNINSSPEQQANDLGLSSLPELRINKANCELCGAPHAVLSVGNKVTDTIFFFSGSNVPDEQDKRFIEDFRKRFFSS